MLMKFTRAQVKLIWAQALVGPGVDTPLNVSKITHIYMLKILGLAMPKHTSTFYQDFLQHIFQQGLLPPRAPLKPPMTDACMVLFTVYVLL